MSACIVLSSDLYKLHVLLLYSASEVAFVAVTLQYLFPICVVLPSIRGSDTPTWPQVSIRLVVVVD